MTYPCQKKRNAYEGDEVKDEPDVDLTMCCVVDKLGKIVFIDGGEAKDIGFALIEIVKGESCCCFI